MLTLLLTLLFTLRLTLLLSLLLLTSVVTSGYSSDSRKEQYSIRRSTNGSSSVCVSYVYLDMHTHA